MESHLKGSRIGGRIKMGLRHIGHLAACPLSIIGGVRDTWVKSILVFMITHLVEMFYVLQVHGAQAEVLHDARILCARIPHSGGSSRIIL
jgi:hypothetical protein